MIDNIEIMQTVKIDKDKIEDLLITAFEQGSNYWACLGLPTNWKEKYSEIEEIPFKGGKIDIYNVETDDLLGVLNLASIQTGLQLMANNTDMTGKKIPERHFKNIISDNNDAETADVFLQLSVMGEIIYG